MKSLFFYLLQVVACSGVLYAYYHFFLRNKRFHQYNRYFLLATVMISIILPFVKIPVYFDSSTASPVLVKTWTIIASTDFEEEPGGGAHNYLSGFISLRTFVYSLYLVIGLLLLLRFIASILKVVRLYRHSEKKTVHEIKFIDTDEPSAPFSFFSWLFWNRRIDLHSVTGQQVLRHELFHIRQQHSWDVTALETASILFWLNPFFHLIKKEIRAIHEFLADQHAVQQSSKWDYAELLVMQALGSRHSNVTNPFFNNQIKRRIAMLTNSSKPGYQYLRKLMVLPMAAVIVLLFAFTYKRHGSHDNARLAEPVTIVIDAAHGGNDPGVKSPGNEFSEAALSLEIAKTIQSMAAGYNVNVVMTRETNELPGGATNKEDGLKNRVAIVNKTKPFALLSIHLNSRTGGESFQEEHSGIEAYVSGKRNDENGKRLASIILDQLSGVYKTRQELRIRPDQGIWVLDKAECAAILLELGFIDNRKDVEFFRTKANQEEIARKILSSIVNFKSKEFSMAAAIDTIPKKNRTTTRAGAQPTDNIVFEKTEIEASYDGGSTAWKKFLDENLNTKVPLERNAPQGHYTVFLQFIVDRHGAISEIKPLTNYGFGMEDEAIRVIKKSPNWLPAVQNGKKVTAYKKQPFNFIVSKNGKRPGAATVIPNNS